MQNIMNAAVDVVSMSPGLASWVTSCLACHASAWITLVQSGSLLVLHVLVLTASQCVSLCIRLLFSRSASAPKESLCKLFPGYMPFFFSFMLHYFQDILPFVFHNLLAIGRICMASILQMSMQLCRLCVDCLYQIRLQMEFVQSSK